MLVTIFGPDGAGKTTQIKKLLKLYQEAGLSTASIHDVMPDFNYQIGSNLSRYYQYFKNFDVIHTRFRLHTIENAQVMNILEVIPPGTDVKLAALSAYTSYHAYIQWYKYVQEPLLSAGKLLICDKYFFDDIASRSAFGCPYKWLKTIHYDTPRPDLSLYMQVDGNTLRERNKYREDGRIIHYHSSNDINRLLYYYSQIAKDEKATIIDANQSFVHIASDIQKELKKYNLMPDQYILKSYDEK